MTEDRPQWARRMTAEREVRGWSQAEAVKAMRMHANKLPDDANLLRQWKRWEAVGVTTSDFYQRIIAATFGTVTHAFFPVPGKRELDTELANAGMSTLELVSRLKRSDMDDTVLDALRITADRLCSEYPFQPPDQLLTEGRAWLRRINGYQDRHLSLRQHRELLVQAGWLALLVGCVEYDTGDRHAAETTRLAALSLGEEAEHAEIQGWAHEIKAWMALTTGDYNGVIAASRAGIDAAPHHSVSVQLAAQEAKAWARIGDRRQTEVALDHGRRLLDSMPYPENLDNHFVVDQTKFDFYAMDCYRTLTEDNLAGNLAEAVIHSSVDFDGTDRAPMRLSEARITLGVIAARQGDLEQAIHHGENALRGQRRSLPSLMMVSRDLTRVLRDRYRAETATTEYLHYIDTLTQSRAEA